MEYYWQYENSPSSPISIDSSNSSSPKGIAEWDVEDVVDLCVDIGLEDYCENFRQATIDGQTLLFLDHEALKDLGVISVGHRLRLLRAVYDNKQRNGLALDESDWLPPSVSSRLEFRNLQGPGPQEEGYESKLFNLESELSSTRVELNNLQHLVSTMTSKQQNRRPNLSLDISTGTRAKEGRTRSSSLTPTAAASTGLVISRPVLPNPTPNTEMKRNGYFDLTTDQTVTPPLSPYESPTPKTASTQQSRYSTIGMSQSANNIACLKSPASPERKSLVATTKSGPPKKSSSADTCLQVLPAAVKKYSLKHPWYEYSMIVVWRNNKRALSYDERPRVVVHALRAQGEEVSCLVQHQSELKSPLALCSSRKAKMFRKYLDAESPAIVPPSPSPQFVDDGKTLPLNIRERLPPVARFCLSIFPYSAENDKELDTEFGECFVLVNKDSSSCQVQRTVEDPSQRINQDRVPSSILLEIYTLPSTKPNGTRVLDGNHISNCYLTAYALIDRATSQIGEVPVSKGDKLRVYARCTHWSFAVKERAHEFGWIPTWIISSSSAANIDQMTVSGPESPKPNKKIS